MIHVEVKDGNVENAMKRLKVKFQKAGVPSVMKNKKEYKKPGVRRKEARENAIKNAKKNARKNRNQ